MVDNKEQEEQKSDDAKHLHSTQRLCLQTEIYLPKYTYLPMSIMHTYEYSA